MSRYERAITVFSPEGQLLQVEYALEAIHKCSPIVGVRGPDVIVLAVEKRAVERLQDDRTEAKICELDDHIGLTFAGLRADARVMITRAQIECQSYRLMVEDSVSVEYIARFMAEMKQKYTQSNGRRPFGVSCLVGGFDCDGGPHLFQTLPSGVYFEWKAVCAGKKEKTAMEYLEKKYNDEIVSSDSGAIKLAINALLQVVQSDRNKLDVAVIRRNEKIKLLDYNIVKAYVSTINKEENINI